MNFSAKIRGVNISISSEGQGYPFIWGHGITSSRAYEDASGLYRWKEIPGVKTIRYDARGHGDSEPSFNANDYVWSSLAVDMLGIAEIVGGDKYVLGGTSMGCATALHAAIKRPNLVAGLVLVNPPVGWESRNSSASRYKHLANVIEKQGFSALLDQIEDRPLPQIFQDEYPQLTKIKLDHFKKIDKKALPYIYHGAARSDFPQREQIQNLTIPTLILAWSGDPGHPVDIAQSLNLLMKQSEIHIANNFTSIKRWPVVLRNFFLNILN